MKQLIIPNKKIFTLASIIGNNPTWNNDDINRELKNKVNGQRIYFIGKQQVGNVKYGVYSESPINKIDKKLLKPIEIINERLTSKQLNFIRKIFKKNFLVEILTNAEFKLKKIIKVHKGKARTGLISDNFSTLFGTCLAEAIRNKFKIEVEEAVNNNNKPDIRFPHLDLNFEIKATATKNTWRGGQFSDRPYPTVLLSYDAKKSEYFIGMVPKVKWVLWSMGGNKKMYGPPLTWDDFIRNYPEKEILFGGISEDDKMVRLPLK